METAKEQEVLNGFRAMNTDFTNNDQRDGYDVFYDDQGSNVIPPTLRPLTDNQLLDELAAEKQVRRV